MPRVLREFPGGVEVQLDDGTVTAMPAEMVSGFANVAGTPLEPPTSQPQQQLPEVLSSVPPTSPTSAPPTPNPNELAPGQSISRSGTRPYSDPKLVNKDFGIPEVQDAAQVLAPIQTAGAQEKATLGERGDLEAKRAEAAQPFQDQERDLANDRVRQVEESNARATAEATAWEAQIQEKLAAVPKADPGQWWDNRSTLQKAVLISGAFAAGFGGGAKGAESWWNTIDGFIRTDMQAQQTNIETARDKVFRAERGAERARLSTADRMRGENEAYLTRLASIKAGLQAEQAKYDSPLIQNEWQQKIDRIDKGIAEKVVETGQMVWNQSLAKGKALADIFHQRNQEQIQRAGIAQRANEFSEEMAFKRDQASLAASAAAAENTGVLPDPLTGNQWTIGVQTADKKERLKNWADPKTGISGYAHLTSELKEYLALSDKLGRSYSGPGARTSAVLSEQQQMRAELDGKYNQIVQKTRHALFGAAFTKNEEKAFEAALPKPDALLGPEGASIIKGYIKTKSEEAQREFINPLKIKGPDGKDVNLVKEWGEIELPNEAQFQNSEALNTRGRALGAGLSALPRDSAGNVPEELGRTQVKALLADATELANRANNFADRTGLTPEVAAESVDMMHEWAARLSSAGYERESDQVLQKARKIQDLANAQVDSTPLDVVKTPNTPMKRPPGFFGVQ